MREHLAKIRFADSNPEKQKGPQLLSVLVASLLLLPSSRCYLVSTPRATEAIF